MKKSIKFKIISVFILVLLVLIANSIWAVVTFRGLSNSIENIMESNYRSVVAAQNMIVALERQDSAELSAMFATDKSSNDIFLENEKIFFKWLSRAEDNITESGEQDILEKINTLYTQYIQNFYVLNEIQNNGDMSRAREYYYNNILPLFEHTKSECRNLQNLNQDAMVTKKNQAHNIAKNASYSTLLISLTTILIGLIAALYLTNKIVKPVYDLIGKIKKISEGDYSQQLDIAGKDEIGELAREFNTMTEKLKSYELINIKKLKKEKQKAEAIVESISDGIIVTDEANRLILVNRAAEKALGISEKEVLNRHFLEVIKHEDMFELINNIKTGKNVNYKKYLDISISNDSQIKHYRVNAKPIKDKEDNNIGVVVLMQDITKLKEVDQMKSDFVSTVSHEFRTPLTSIGMAVGLLLDKVPGDINNEQHELLEAIKEDNERLKNLVSDLLDLSRLESGKIHMDIQSYDLNKIINHAVKPFYIQAKEKDISIEVNIGANLSKVKADFNKISWVLTNLVGNAIRYTPKDGTGKIVVTAKEAANKMLISVSDNGNGIPEEYQQKIFEKFIQVKDGSNENTGGTGLGLAISKEIIKAHGGEIWVESKVGEGSTFYFTLYTGT